MVYATEDAALMLQVLAGDGKFDVHSMERPIPD